MKKIYITEQVKKYPMIGLISSNFDFVHEFSDDLDGILYIPENCFHDLESKDGGSLENDIIEFIHNAPIVGRQARLNKIQQHIVLNSFNIKTPNTFYNEKTNKPYKTFGEILSGTKDMDEFVIKPLNGAKGWGVELYDNLSLQKALDNSYNTSFISELESISEKQDPMIREEISYSQQVLRDFDFAIQEKVNIKREFRAIVTNSGFMIYERVSSSTSKNGLKKSNIQEDFDVNSLPELEEKLLVKINDTIIKVQEVLNKFNYPWLSIDLYQDEEGEIGVLEFQTEFAFKGFMNKLNELVELLTTGLEESLEYRMKNGANI
ncbi:hypothetical protein BPT24_063 [Tenacibaculum phage pT24]|uniref:ATP-grasp domain-containing protein n=1 Tax=Tenacibaculum phage pT24 TaxID=1880590 RepID=A0A1W7GKP4_9CAUD|nr:hypothetical protein HYP10_gp063 [Tenacibaculum phage pT24]BAX25552.1 hypothetical protein BPT24_063 [Tenacibaculum phage pT24]